MPSEPSQKASIQIKVYFDPMFQMMLDEANADPAWGQLAHQFAEADNVCISDFRNGAVFSYPSDEFLEAFYNHLASKGKK